MSFFAETATLLGYDEARLALGYSAILFNGEAVYIEGIGALLSLSDTELAFKLKRGVLYVRGAALRVAELRQNSVLVRGTIETLSTQKAEADRG